jgi:hypothetical protein
MTIRKRGDIHNFFLALNIRRSFKTTDIFIIRTRFAWLQVGDRAAGG